jgi:hypothetical protein
MTKDEALKLALEALEANQPVNYCMNSNGERFPMMHEDPFRFDRNTKAIAAIKEALAQPEQRQWVGLTIYEIDDAFNESMKVRPKEASNAETRRLFAQAIEAKLKEKNA